jgi:hydrogenase/urease accessory protein HupE
MRSSPTARLAPGAPLVSQRRRNSFLRRLLVPALAYGICASPAHAHTEFASLGVFWSGAAHFLLSFERPALVVAFAIWAGTHKQRADAALVGAIGLGTFIAGLATRPEVVESHSASTIAIVALVLLGAAGIARVQLGARPILIAAVCCGLIAGAIGATGETIRDRVINASALSLVAAAAAAYALMASSYVARWRRPASV